MARSFSITLPSMESMPAIVSGACVQQRLHCLSFDRAGTASDGAGDVVVLQHPRHGKLAMVRFLPERAVPVLDADEHVVSQHSADEPAPSLHALHVTLGRRLARSVFATQDALLHGREHNLADAELLAGRHHLGLDDAVQSVVSRLVGDQRDAKISCQRVCLAQLLGCPLADADIESLASLTTSAKASMVSVSGVA